MEIKKTIRLPAGEKVARQSVYLYMQANGYYPVDEQRTHFTTNSRGEGFNDPRRWEQTIHVSYLSSDNRGILVEIALRLCMNSFWMQNPPIFTASDERYYRGFMEHLANSLEKNKVGYYNSEEVKSSRSGLKQFLYYAFLIVVFLSPVLLFTGDFFSHEWPGSYVWMGFIFVTIGWVIYRYIDFRRRTIRL